MIVNSTESKHLYPENANIKSSSYLYDIKD